MGSNSVRIPVSSNNYQAKISPHYHTTRGRLLVQGSGEKGVGVDPRCGVDDTKHNLVAGRIACTVQPGQRRSDTDTRVAADANQPITITG